MKDGRELTVHVRLRQGVSSPFRPEDVVELNATRDRLELLGLPIALVPYTVEEPVMPPSYEEVRLHAVRQGLLLLGNLLERDPLPVASFCVEQVSKVLWRPFVRHWKQYPSTAQCFTEANTWLYRVEKALFQFFETSIDEEPSTAIMEAADRILSWCSLSERPVPSDLLNALVVRSEVVMSEVLFGVEDSPMFCARQCAERTVIGFSSVYPAIFLEDQRELLNDLLTFLFERLSRSLPLHDLAGWVRWTEALRGDFLNPGLEELDWKRV